MFDAEDSDVFDVLAHLSYGEEIKTRTQRVQRALANSHTLSQSYEIQAKEFLDYLLQYYEQYGSTQLVQSKIGEVIKLYGRG